MCPPRELYTLVIKSQDRISGSTDDYQVDVGHFFNNLPQQDQFLGNVKECIVHRSPYSQGYLEVKCDLHLPYQYETNNTGLPSIAMIGKVQSNTGSLFTDRRRFIFTKPTGSHLRIKLTTYDTEDDATNIGEHCLVLEITPLS